MSIGKKRFWSDDEKREICTQTRIEGVSVAQVARRYAMNANLIHKWLRDPRFSEHAGGDAGAVSTAGFLPVEIEDGKLVSDWIALAAPDNTTLAPLCAPRVDLTLSDGRRVLIEGSTSLCAVVSLVEGLTV